MSNLNMRESSEMRMLEIKTNSSYQRGPKDSRCLLSKIRFQALLINRGQARTRCRTELYSLVTISEQYNGKIFNNAIWKDIEQSFDEFYK